MKCQKTFKIYTVVLRLLKCLIEMLKTRFSKSFLGENFAKKISEKVS